MSNELPNGIYEELLTSELSSLLSSIDSSRNIVRLEKADESLANDYLTRTLAKHISKSLNIVSSKSDNAHRRYDLANHLLQSLELWDEELEFLAESKFVAAKENLLTEIRDLDSDKFDRPSTPLSTPTLFTGATGSPQLGKELELELETADRVDMLVSFIKSAGINLLYPSLERFTRRGGKLRVITTTYLGASDPAAIHKLKELPNTEVKVSYDTKHSRLHAKAYFIHRDSGLSCAYIGSANLSHAAMTSWLEWTVKLPVQELPDLFRRCEAQFDGYWESEEFKTYSPEDFEFLVKAVRLEKYTPTDSTKLSIFEFRPHSHQQIVLDQLCEAREQREHFRNLVVAATGTGKTMIAAFDYKRLCKGSSRPKLLFLAHRKEILKQAIDSFRHVLADGNFGEELYDGKSPEHFDYLFCSVNSFNTRNLVNEFPNDFWDMVILDEAHHGKANSYRDILNVLNPQWLLGLTATPERTDGSSIIDDFDSPLAAEIRLPDALEQKLLCPFHYYAVSDHTVDFASLSWSNGKHSNSEIDNLIDGNTARIDLIIKKVIEYFPAPLDPDDYDRESLKAIAFCINQKHAHEMANAFNKAGIPSIALDANSDRVLRQNAQNELTTGKLNFIFTVDLYNEGVDIPAINGILFLRPTESHVIYQQQLGRGLRNHDGKDQLIVLDFVGTIHKKFRFDQRLKGLLPGRRHNLKKEIEEGFPHLPAGCFINFEKKAHEEILKNIKLTYSNIDERIAEAFLQFDHPPKFADFIAATQESPIDLLSRRSWSAWKARSYPNYTYEKMDIEPELNTQARISMVNDGRYIEFLNDLLSCPVAEIDELLKRSTYTASAYYLIWNKKGSDWGFSSYIEAFQRLLEHPSYTNDLLDILEYSRTKQLALNPKTPHPHGLRLHALYTMREITAAFGKATIQTSGPIGTGVVHIKEAKTYLHLVTFEKSEKLFSESTMYRDYLSSRDVLHWESQSSTTQQSATGQNYLKHREKGYKILFFARMRKAEGKLTSPFTYLGEGTLEEATGNRPISIIWKLDYPVSHEFFHEAKIASGLS